MGDQKFSIHRYLATKQRQLCPLLVGRLGLQEGVGQKGGQWTKLSLDAC